MGACWRVYLSVFCVECRYKVSLEGINMYQMKEMGEMGEFASRGHQHTDAVAGPG